MTRRLSVMWAGAVAMMALLAWAGEASAQSVEVDASCTPTCDAGQTCVKGVCMVPATAGAPPPPTQPPAPQNPVGPPPGYPPPPPGYAPGYYPPPPGLYNPPVMGPTSPLPPRRRGFLALPYVGIHSYQNAGATNTGPGFRIGTLLGGRINETFSLNGEITIDFTNPKDLPAGIQVHETVADVTFSPLVHIPAGQGEFVLGAKLGLFAISETQSDGTTTVTGTASGTVLGLNAGGFFAVSDGASLGALLSLEIKTVDRACVSSAALGGEMCSSNVNSESAKVVGLTGAALF